MSAKQIGRAATRLFSLGLLCFGAAVARAAFPVVTTTTDLQSLVQAVGGDRVTVAALVPAGAEAEDYAARPQDVERLRGAGMVVRVGLDYDLWLDRLLRQVGRARLMRGGDAHVDASNAITLLEVKAGGLNQADGHAHGAGNPHYWLDPANAQVITGNIVEALARLDPSNAKFYERRRIEFLDQLDARIQVWQQRLAPLAGRPLLTYHNNWPYLARRFRLHLAGTIEPRPGVPPSPAVLASLLQRVREQNIDLIVRHPQEPARDVDFLARKTGARVVVLAASVGDLPGAKDYLSLFEANVAALVSVAEKARR